MASAEAVTDFLGLEPLHRSETFCEFRKQRRASRGEQFVRHVDLRERNSRE